MRKNTILRGKHFVTCVLFAVNLFFLAQAVKSDEEQGNESDAQKERFMEQWFKRWVASRNVDFILKGVVVDESENMLKGVTVFITKSRQSLDIFGTQPEEPEYETRTVDGRFSFKFKSYSLIQLHFACGGYYEEYLDFAPEDDLGEKELEINKPLPKRTVINENIRVVLEKQGTLTHLIEGGAELEYRTNSMATVYDFSRHGDKKNKQYPVVVSNVQDAAQLPANCVYFLPSTNADGSLATNVLAEDIGLGQTIKRIFPKSIRLIMHAADPGSGFVATDVQSKGRRFGTQRMTTAPESGYNKELTLDPAFFEKHIKTRGEDYNTQYFYFRLQDRYGKGSIRVEELRVWDEDKKTVVTVIVSFQLQPDGSRNLETGE